MFLNFIKIKNKKTGFLIYHGTIAIMIYDNCGDGSLQFGDKLGFR
jgi:hypothetical protein